MRTAEAVRTHESDDDGWWHRARRTVIARELRRLGSPGRAIDIDAAGGGDTLLLLRHGWLATAVDGSDHAIELARSRGLDTHRGDPTRLLLPSQTYDLALALEVFQRIDDDHAAAAEITRVLRPGGSVLVSVPCDPRLWSGHDVVMGNIRRYTRRTLTELLDASGLTIDRMWSWNVLLRPWHASRWPDHRGPMARALFAVLSAERLLPVSGLPGTTLMARAHRS